MNGKNRRVKGCFSRGLPTFTILKKAPLPSAPPLPTYNLPVFSNSLTENLNQGQKALTQYFETYSYVQKEEEYSFNTNTPGAIIKLRQSNFTNGTVRITKPGIYILQENINFEPNPNNDFMPTGAQIVSGQYPVGTAGAYHLGFFAAITIEATGVILDLNGKTIQQTKLHSLQQRFFANIEMASAPFIPNQGPGDFSNPSNFVAGEKVLIKNGVLARSSHHGIHGNKMKDIIIQDLSANEFEVAGIALNGAINSILYNIDISGTSLDMRILSTYSQARFIRSFLNTVKSRNPTGTFNGQSIQKIISDISGGLNEAKDAVMAGNTPTNMFGNNNFADGYDGNVYGLVLNVNGVVINGFIETRPSSAIGNQDIYLQDITIKNIISRPVEIIALNATPAAGGAYAGSRQAGPVGDVLEIENVTDTDRTYKENILANAQLIIAKNNDPKLGTTNIESSIVNWAENNSDLSGVMDANNYYYVKGGDSMGHTMKGNIGLFISAGENIKVNKCNIQNVISKGSAVGPDASGVHLGGDARGVIVTGSKNIDLDSSVITNIVTENSNSTAQDIQVLGTSTNIKKDGVPITV
jgi:hypothetical protein